MRAAVLAFALVVCFGQGRRVQLPHEQLQGIPDKTRQEASLESLAMLLLGHPELPAAWQASALSVPHSPSAMTSRSVAHRHASALHMAADPDMLIDLNDPDIKDLWDEFDDWSDSKIRKELKLYSIEPPAGWDDFKVRQMFVQVYMAENPIPVKKESYSSKAEEYEAEKPAFRKLLMKYKKTKDIYAYNFCKEHVNDPEKTKGWFPKTEGRDNSWYEIMSAEVDNAIKAPVIKTAKTGKLKYSGWPVSLEPDQVKGIMSEFGEVTEFTCEENRLKMNWFGRITFKDAEAAQAVIDKWDGTDMGGGEEPMVIEPV